MADEQDPSLKLRLARFDGMLARAHLARRAGLTFDGKRNVAEAAGYDDEITSAMYRRAYDRGGIAKRIVDAFPDATWRGVGDLVEDEDPNVSTAFEEAWRSLRDRLNVWRIFHKADRLAGIGKYSVVLIGTRGAGPLEQELTRTSADKIAFLWAFQEDDAQIATRDENPESERFALPLTYRIARLSKDKSKQIVHWSRVIHLADDAIDDPCSGTPRLQAVWDLLTNLAKVNAAGPESYWRNADPGRQFKIDPELVFDDIEKAKAREETEAFAHGLSRSIWTRGVDVEEFKGQTANMKNHVDPLYEQISGTTGIPLRILKGSERGELASTQDRENWNDRIRERRDDFADPFIVRPFIDRMIAIGALPKPVEYHVRWPRLTSMTTSEAVDAVDKIAGAGQKIGTPVMIVDELREIFLDLAPMSEVLPDDEADDFLQGITREAPEVIEAELVDPIPELPPAVARAAAEAFDNVSRSEQPPDAPWRAVHRAADKHAAAFVDHFSALFTEARNLVSVKRLEKDVRSNDRESAFVNLNRAITHVERNIGDGLIKVLEETIGDGGDAAAKATPSSFRANALEMNFDRANHEAARWARERSSTLIVQITSEMRDAIRLIIERGFEQRKTPRETARVLRSMVGLTDRQAASLQKRYAELLTQGYTATDSARVIMREADRKLAARAMLIARTETLAASNEGARELWAQAQREGVISDNARREWIATEGKRTCKICAAMDGQVRMLHEPFTSPTGLQVMSPPLHPACRCAHGVTNRQRRAPEVAA